MISRSLDSPRAINFSGVLYCGKRFGVTLFTCTSVDWPESITATKSSKLLVKFKEGCGFVNSRSRIFITFLMFSGLINLI